MLPTATDPTQKLREKKQTQKAKHNKAKQTPKWLGKHSISVYFEKNGGKCIQIVCFWVLKKEKNMANQS